MANSTLTVAQMEQALVDSKELHEAKSTAEIESAVAYAEVLKSNISASELIMETKRLSTRKVAFLGDSITEEADDVSTYRNRGYAIWAMVFTFHRFEISGIFGYPGAATSTIASNVSEVVNSGADICFVLSGANDILNGVTIQSVTDNYDLIISTLKQNSILPVFLSVFPRNNATPTENERAALMTNYLKSKATSGEISLIDAAKIMQVDESTINTNFSYDGVHTNVIGAYAIGRLVANWLDENFPASNNPVQYGESNYLDNPFLTGTGGTKQNVNGTVPSDWTAVVTNSGGETVTASIEDVEVLSSEKAMRFDVTGDGTTRFFNFQQSVNLPAGQYYLYAEYEKTGNLEMVSMGCSARSFSAPTFNNGSLSVIESNAVLPEDAIAYATKTKVFTAEESQSVVAYIGFSFKNGVGTVRIKNVAMVKVA